MDFWVTDGDYCCTRFRVYTYLKSKGFKETGIKPDRNNPKYYVWFFKRSQKLKDALEEYFSRNKH